MSNWKKEKFEFEKLVVDYGIGSPGELGQILPLGHTVPVEKLNKWLGRIVAPPKKFSTQRRYVNRFKLGADPEFVFGVMVPNVGAVDRMDAQRIGLKQGPAFGADNNGRLAEIRPHPSRSAVEVVASVLNTLRWLAVLEPETLKYGWLAGAYLFQDGVGGHVHFGRKRPFRNKEVEALDVISKDLEALNVYPLDQQTARRNGDARRQHYGMLGDFRLQTHGYEYRTFPSWLDSPEMAFLTLVLSKLAVYCPELVNFRGALPPTNRWQKIKNLLGVYKNQDDDARLALMMIQRGMPSYIGGDFRGRWGIKEESIIGPLNPPLPKFRVVPMSFKPDKQSIQEVFDKLFGGGEFKFRVPEVNWGPVNPPKGYDMLIENTKTILCKGMGEMIWDLCFSKEYPMQLIGNERGTDVVIPYRMEKSLPKDWRARLATFGLTSVSADNPTGILMISSRAREGRNVRATRAALTSGLFPIWNVKDAKEGSWEEYEKWRSGNKRELSLAGSVLWESGNWKVGPLA